MACIALMIVDTIVLPSSDSELISSCSVESMSWDCGGFGGPVGWCGVVCWADVQGSPNVESCAEATVS